MKIPTDAELAVKFDLDPAEVTRTLHYRCGRCGVQCVWNDRLYQCKRHLCLPCARMRNRMKEAERALRRKLEQERT